MILYHIINTYQLLYSICHRLTVHRDEDCCLILTEYLMPKEQLGPLSERLVQSGWFSFVRIVPEAMFKLSRGHALNEKSSDELIETVVRNISSTFEKWLDFDIKACKQRYIGSDQWSLGIYLIYNRIPYVYMEDASGMLSQQERYLRITKRLNLTNYVISNYLGGAGRNSCVTGYLCDRNNQQPGFACEKTIDFSIYRAVSGMSRQERQKLLDFYGAKPVSVRKDEKTCLFLSQYLTTLAVNELAVQELISTLLVDYFAQDCRLIIKPHPKDKWLDYNRIFPGCAIIPEKINSELLPFMLDASPERVVTLSSTSIGGLKDFIPQQYSPGIRAETHYEQLHIYYALSELVKCLDFRGEIQYHRTDSVQADCFLRQLGQRAGTEKMLVGDGVCFEDCHQTSYYDAGVFLNTAPYAGSVTGSMLSQAEEIKIRLTPDEDSLAEPLRHSIYVYCRDEERRKRLRALSVQRRLNYTKAEIQLTAAEIGCKRAEKLSEKYNKIRRSYFHEIQIGRIRPGEAE